MLSGLEQHLLRTWLRPVAVALFVFFGVLLSGCFIPAPIEEEEPEPQFPPEITQVEPSPLSLLSRDLDALPIIVFALLEVSDPNENDTLFMRTVYDTGERAIRLKDTEIPVGDRENITVQFSPCDPQHALFVEKSRETFEGLAVLNVYMAVADTPFAFADLQTLPPNAVEKQLQTDVERPLAVVQWTVRLQNSCP